MKMQQQAERIHQKRTNETVWCCQHPPVYTTGRRGIDNRIHPHLPAPLVTTDRGGETTFHGPGQLMFYPFIHLKQHHLQARAFVTLLEASCIELLHQYSISSKQRDGAPGVWSQQGKIAAIGLRISCGIAYHGMALNVNTDLDWFRAIRPCGLQAGVDRFSDHTTAPPLEQLAQQWFEIFKRRLDRTITRN